jgi:carboxyl-terminal processing protease
MRAKHDYDGTGPTAGRRFAPWIIVWLLAAMMIPGWASAFQNDSKHLESFDYVWTTIRDRHFDPQLGGLDWVAVRDELRPRLQQAESTQAARSIMRDMLGRLGQSHFGIIPAGVLKDLGGPVGEGSTGGSTGLDVRVIDGRALVTRVAEPAAGAGVRPGWEILQVGGDAIPPILKTIEEEFAGKTSRQYTLAGAVQARLDGRIGDRITVKFLDGEDQSREITMTLSEKRGQRQKMGHISGIHVWIETERLDPNVGYIAFSGFLGPAYVMPVFNDAMKSFMKCDGIIIDLRGNGGGMIPMAMGMAGWLVEEKSRRLGTLYLRNNELKAIVTPRATVYSGPVAVLVDGLSLSCAEIFAAGLQDLDRARVFGMPSGGAVLGSQIEKLPNGDGFQYVFANYVSENGQILEGVGVTPDEVITPDRKALLEGKDPVIEGAMEWIRNQKGGADYESSQPN